MPPVFRQGHDQSRCQDPTRYHPVRGDVEPEPRASSASSILDLAVERRASSFLLRFVRSPSHPCRPTRSVRPRPGRTADPRYPAPPRFALRLPSVGSGKMLLTDICNRRTTRALVNRSIYRAHGFRRADPAVLPPVAHSEPKPRARNERSSCVAPDRLATIRPRLASRSTAQDQLQPVATRCSTPPSLEGRGVGVPSRVPAPSERCPLR
jgi:hypothetical protein